MCVIKLAGLPHLGRLAIYRRTSRFQRAAPLPNFHLTIIIAPFPRSLMQGLAQSRPDLRHGTRILRGMVTEATKAM
jgi:hypothetical protein